MNCRWNNDGVLRIFSYLGHISDIVVCINSREIEISAAEGDIESEGTLNTDNRADPRQIG